MMNRLQTPHFCQKPENLRQPSLVDKIFPLGTVITLALFFFLCEAACLAQGTNPPATPAVHAAVDTNSVDLLNDKYRLVIGDQLSFRIVEDEEEPKTLIVTDSGEIQVPYLGRFSAVGKTCKELSLALKAELEKKYYYQATVVIAVDSKPRTRAGKFTSSEPSVRRGLRTSPARKP